MIERHIERKGTSEFTQSNLVITERRTKFNSKAPRPTTTKQDQPPIFDINNSNMVLMETKKKEVIQMLGMQIKIEDSDDEDPHFMQRLLKETEQKKDEKKES